MDQALVGGQGDKCGGRTEEQIVTPDECLEYCGQIARWEPGQAGEMFGNTVACRIAHTGDADDAVHRLTVG